MFSSAENVAIVKNPCLDSSTNFGLNCTGNNNNTWDFLHPQYFNYYEDLNFTNESFENPENNVNDPETHLGFSGWALLLILVCLVLMTMVGNLLVCLSVFLVRKLRKPQNYLLVSLATSDLFVAVFVMPFAIVFEVNGGVWPLNEGLCDLWVAGKYIFWFLGKIGVFCMHIWGMFILSFIVK